MLTNHFWRIENKYKRFYEALIPEDSVGKLPH